MSQKPMNFVVIVSDTFRRDHMGAYGNQWISTPNLDAFAAESLVFDRAYSASFPTVPHRHDLLTGRFTATYAPWGPLPKDETVLAQVLTDAGYWTMMVSDTNHTLEHGYFYERGFEGFEWIRGQENDHWKTDAPRLPKCDPGKLRKDESLRHYRNRAYWTSEADTFVARTMTTACDWLEGYKREDPFFLYVDTFDPHEPWDPPQHYVDLYDPGYQGEVVDYPHYDYVDGYLTDAEVKHCRALYAGEITLVDRWAGRLLQRIRDLGLMENTMVLFTADHGFLHGEHGIIGKSIIAPGRPCSVIPLYDEISHIPFICRTPGGITGRSDAIVQPPDIMPTILAAAGVEIPDTVQGKSILPIAKGQSKDHRRRAFSFSYVDRPDSIATITEGKWQCSIRPTKTRSVSDDITLDVDGLPKPVAWNPKDNETPLLYDIEVDPQQSKNLADQYPEVVSGMRSSFIELLEQCGSDADVVDLWKEN